MKWKEALSSKLAKKGYLLLGFVVILFILCNSILLPLYVRSRESVVVPYVVGVKFEEAKQLLDSLGLETRKGDIRQDNEHPEGTVITQNPPDGVTVKKGRRIYLVVSSGEVLATVPNVKGRTLREAKFALEREGIKLGAIQYQGSDQFPANTVIDQQIAAGTNVKRGKYISVVVSQGSMAEKVAVPDLKGKTLSEGQKLLTAAGLKLGNITYVSTVELLPNTIVDNFPASGVMVPVGQAVDLVVVQSGDKQKQLFEN